jgi:Mat/Ecp fimbriae outer membrane usher protein
MSEIRVWPVKRHARTALLCCSILSVAAPMPAFAQAPPVFQIGEPEGFSSITGETTVLVDLYFGGIRRGEAQIKVRPGSITIADPSSVSALLPEVSSPALIEAALGAPELPANSGFACAAGSDRAQCGRLTPPVVGVIYDRERFRLDLFINPRFLAIVDRPEAQYLPNGRGGLSLINSLGAIVTGQTGLQPDFYNFSNQFVLSRGSARARGDLSLVSGFGVSAERLSVELDRPGLRYSVGAMWAPGTELAGRRKLVGFGLESQIDTRLDKDAIVGSPIVLYLGQRARVDVVQGGRVLSSAMYGSGNQRIDTSNLPDGSYEVTLRVQEPGSGVREERRFFTKNRKLPSLGRTDYYAFAGLLVDDWRHGSIEPSGQAIFQGGAAHRISENWAVTGTVEATPEGAAAELGGTWIAPFAQVRVVALATSDGARGGIVHLASTGSSRLNFNFDLRRIEGYRVPASGADPAGPTRPFGDLPGAGRSATASYSQLSGLVSYSLAHLRLLGTAFVRDDREQDIRYSIGPALEWDFLRRGPILLTMRGEIAVSEQGRSGFAGVSMRILGSGTSFSSLGGVRLAGKGSDERGGAIVSLTGSWSDTIAGGDLAFSGALDRQPLLSNASFSGDFRHPLGSLAGFLAHSSNSSNDGLQYSFGAQTTLAAGSGTLRLTASRGSDGLIIARVEGARTNDKFEVLVNEQIAGTIEGNRSLSLNLPSYRTYDLRMRAIGDQLVAYDNTPRRVALYPGTVMKVDWASVPIVVKIGRLVSADNRPMADAAISGPGILSVTDADGYFQVEAPEGVELSVTTAGEQSCSLRLPTGKPSSGVFQVGAVQCSTPPGQGPRLSSLTSVNGRELQ